MRTVIDFRLCEVITPENGIILRSIIASTSMLMWSVVPRDIAGMSTPEYLTFTETLFVNEVG
jgi:hypothetical protein